MKDDLREEKTEVIYGPENIIKINNEILEINSGLARSFHDNGEIFSNISELITSMSSTYLFIEKQAIMQIICDYKSINLDKEIECVMYSLRTISEDNDNIISAESFLGKVVEFCNQVLEIND